MDWSFPPDLQQRYEQILAQTRKLQKELGITPRTLEERCRAYEQRKEEEKRKEEELIKLQNQIKSHRPLPKWKL